MHAVSVFFFLIFSLSSFLVSSIAKVSKRCCDVASSVEESRPEDAAESCPGTCDLLADILPRMYVVSE